MTQTTRRGFLAATAAGFALPAFAQGDKLPYSLKPGMPYKGVTLRVLAVVTPQFTGLSLRTPQFTKMTGINVQWDFTPFVALQEKVASIGVAADDTYDLVNYLDGWGPANANWFKPLDPLLKEAGISMDRYPPAFAKAASFQGKTNGMPLRSHAQLFYYRVDVLKDIGAEPPKTWDDVVSIGKAMRAKRKDIEPLGFCFHNDGNRQNLYAWSNFVWSAGGQIFDDEMRPAWTEPVAMEATEYYIGLLTKERIVNPDSVSFVEQDMRLSFQQGKTAMMPLWWWAYSPMITPGQSVLKPEQVGFVGVPSYKGKTVTSANAMPFSISTYSSKQDAAWEFLKWLSNPDLDRENAIEREVDGQHIQNNVVNQTVNLLSPEVNAANAGIEKAGYESLKSSDVMPQLIEWPQVGDQISVAIASAAAGGNVKQLMTDAASRSTQILKQAGYF